MKVFSLLILLCFTQSALGQVNYFGLKDSTNLYVEEIGEGETLLFIPGWTMTHRFFEKQKEHFSRQYHVVLYDPRGQGRSDKTTYKNTYAHHAMDLRELILQKDLNEIVLIGWSSGCLTLYEYLRAFGVDRVRKMVFIDEPPKWIGNREEEWVYGTFDDYRSSLRGMISGPSEPDDIIDWMLNDSIDDPNRTWMRKEIRMTPPHIALSLYIDGLVSDYTKEVGQLEIPSVFMVRDSWYDRASSWLKIHASEAKIKAITSHAMFWERAEEFNTLLEDFIDSN